MAHMLKSVQQALFGCTPVWSSNFFEYLEVKVIALRKGKGRKSHVHGKRDTTYFHEKAARDNWQT